MALRIIEVPCLSDNYAYLVAREGSAEAVVIDPSEAAPVAAALADNGLKPVAILATHHHHDHVGGNEALLGEHPGMSVYAHRSDRGRVPGQTVDVDEGQAFEVAGMTFQPWHVPGHTSGAVAYHVEDAVFTGDTLFVAGCGRLFEGTPEMMNDSLNNKLAKLPGDTRVFCGHEYTVSNLTFAKVADPDNPAVIERLAWAQQRRNEGRPTIPSTISDELATNPFMRVAEPSLAKHHGSGTAVEVLAAVRKAKDSF